MTNSNSSALEQLRSLELPSRSYMVMGSGILEALGIRPAEDIDMVVSTELFAYLRDSGWGERTASNGMSGLYSGIFQAYDRWMDESRVKLLDELLIDAEWVDGIPYNSLAKLSLYKERRGRDKDVADLELIKSYQESVR